MARKPTFATLKDPQMNAGGDGWRNTAPLSDDFKPLVVRPHLLYGDNHPPLIDGKPIPAAERYKYTPVSLTPVRSQPFSLDKQYQGIGSLLKSAKIDDYATVLGSYWFTQRRDHLQAWRVVCLLYTADAPQGSDDICDDVTTLSGNAAGNFMKSMINSGLIYIAGQKIHKRSKKPVHTYELTDATSAALSRMAADIRRRQNGDADNGRSVPDPGGIRQPAAETVYRSQNPRIQAAIVVGAEGDD